MRKFTIIIADDHPVVRTGLRALLEEQQDLEVISEASDGRMAVQEALHYQPDLVMMDLTMPHTNGTQAIEMIHKRLPETRLLAVTVHREEEYVRSALKAGADGYILKDDTHDQILVAIRSLLAGKIYLSPTISQRVVDGYLNLHGHSGDDQPSDALTSREREVVKLIVEGKKNREIADYLSISPKTVEKHRSNIMKKLGLKSTPALVAYAIENKLT